MKERAAPVLGGLVVRRPHVQSARTPRELRAAQVPTDLRPGKGSERRPPSVALIPSFQGHGRGRPSAPLQ